MMQAPILIAAEELLPKATPLSALGGWLTDSFVFTAIVTALIIWVCRWATRKMQVVPSGPQNLFEALVETLYNTFTGIVGRHMISKVFPLLATLFIFILASNWFGLVPGVGTVGFGKPGNGLFALSELDSPLLRPGSADLNTTLGLALFFMGWWVFWTIQEVGVIGFLKHNFAPKGDVTGALRLALLPLFLFVGVIELVSIAIRPVSLSFRLFGNMYAGETLLHTMTNIGSALPVPLNYLTSVIFPLPFYFLELLVGALQAFVFAMLCAVYIKLEIGSEEGEHAH
jgi:F-type H+-transporting ATPase subunit a